MKKIAFALLAAHLAALAANAEIKIPKSAEEDSGKVMSQKYWDLWNPEVQKKIDADIEANRKADASFKVREIEKGSKVRVEQISHEFFFGAHIFNFDQLGDKTLNAKYRSLFGTLFNSATVAFYWDKFEMQDGRPRYRGEYWDSQEFWEKCGDPKGQIHWRRPPTDPVIDFLKARGVRVHGHTLVWGNRSYSIPAWLFDKCAEGGEREKLAKILKSPIRRDVKNVPEQYTDFYRKMTSEEFDKYMPNFGRNFEKAFAKRIAELAEYYGGRVDSWDVVNESLQEFAEGSMNAGGVFCKNPRYGFMPADYTFKGFREAQKRFPESVKLNINENPYGPFYLDKYGEQIKDLVSRGCKIDIVGWQMHIFDPAIIGAIANGDEPKNASYEMHMRKVTPKQIWEDFQKIGAAGKPIHMSEITISAPDDTERGRMVQAIVARNLYRIWFSQKPSMGITWWNVLDDCGAPKEPAISGLFTRGMNPKPAFFALDELINKEWKTSLDALPDANGDIKFRGFRGKYRISWKSPDGSEKFAYYNLK